MPSALAVLTLVLPCSIMAAPIIVAINDAPNGPPVIQVLGAPHGYDIYTGDCVNTAGIEEGALITLFGVDTSDSIPDWSGRFVIPNARTHTVRGLILSGSNTTTWTPATCSVIMTCRLDSIARTLASITALRSSQTATKTSAL